tara:strand:+ start:439 stop:918 length:480 start_codon:yes stop_codon:yes gene_type:complete
MPIYKHGPSGAVTAAKRVTATDVFTQDSDGAIIEVEQPAGTLLREVIVRFTNTSTHASSSSAGWELGVTTSAATLGTDIDGFLDVGTSIPENTVYLLRSGETGDAAGANFESITGEASPEAAVGYTDAERTLYLTFLHGDTAVTTNSNVEVNFVFTHLN